MAAIFPCSQSMHELLPIDSWYWPMGQSVHEALSAETYWPLAQSVHDAALETSLYVPAGHTMHAGARHSQRPSAYPTPQSRPSEGVLQWASSSDGQRSTAHSWSAAYLALASHLDLPDARYVPGRHAAVGAVVGALVGAGVG